MIIETEDLIIICDLEDALLQKSAEMFSDLVEMQKKCAELAEPMHADDVEDFRYYIHGIQRIIHARQGRRLGQVKRDPPPEIVRRYIERIEAKKKQPIPKQIRVVDTTTDSTFFKRHAPYVSSWVAMEKNSRFDKKSSNWPGFWVSFIICAVILFLAARFHWPQFKIY